ADTFANDDAKDDPIFTSFAIALTEAGRNEEALAVYERYLPRFPIIDGHYAYALALLAAGRLLEGWQNYEFRWLRRHAAASAPNVLAGPVWSGQSLRGKTILLHVEQGFGDVIQFVRYAPKVKALGATVLLRVARPMKTLMQGIEGVDRVLDRDQVIPEYHFYINLLSLPRVFATALDTIPADIPYIRADSGRARRWAAQLRADTTPRVGLVWAGNAVHPNDRFRSLTWSMLQPIWKVEGVRFVSLQTGPSAAGPIATLQVEVDWVEIGPELEDFSDTAAVISQLDLVICVDTAVAHLAGAMGKPVWVMLPQPADFRWLEGREDSPWYPTMRLFRQSRRDDWTDVIERVKSALEKQVWEGLHAAEPTQTAKPVPVAPQPLGTLAALKAGQRPGLSAVAETRAGTLQYLPDEPIVGDAIGWYGEYLQPQLDLLARIVRPGATLMEVDAGIGAHAVFLGAMLGEAGHLFLYESRPILQRILRQNLAAKGVKNVTVMRLTLGGTGKLDKTAIGEVAGASRLTAGIPITKTLDELQLRRLDWLKVNMNVAALDVLSGASETLWHLRPRLLMGVPDEATLLELTQRAQEFSYRCWRIETALFNPHNFNQRDKDIFGGGTALALLSIPEEIEVDIALDEFVEL
ncbi:MAG: glycosyltransferase family 9 protein, partial [Pyrinomonadaceae bacterium]